MGSIVLVIIALLVAGWFYLTVKKNEEMSLKESFIWTFLGGLCFYGTAKLAIFILSKISFAILVSGDEAISRFVVVGLGCVIGLMVSIFIHTRFMNAHIQ